MPPCGELNVTSFSCRTELPSCGGLHSSLVEIFTASLCRSELIHCGGLNLLTKILTLSIPGCRHYDQDVFILWVTFWYVVVYMDCAFPHSCKTWCDVLVVFVNVPPWINIPCWFLCHGMTLLLMTTLQSYFVAITILLLMQQMGFVNTATFVGHLLDELVWSIYMWSISPLSRHH